MRKSVSGGLAIMAAMSGLMGAPAFGGESLRFGNQAVVRTTGKSGGGKRRRKGRTIRKRSLFSARLGPFDQRPTTGGRNWEWKVVNYARNLVIDSGRQPDWPVVRELADKMLAEAAR